MPQAVDWSYAAITIDQIHNAGYSGAIHYLSSTVGAPQSAKDWTRDQIKRAHELGMGVLAVWEQGTTPASAVQVASWANKELDYLGWPGDRPFCVAFDYDIATAGYSAALDKCQAISAMGRPAGPYGEYGLVEAAYVRGLYPRWQTTAWSYGHLSAGAQLHQLVGGARLPGTDVNDILSADYGQWGPNLEPTSEDTDVKQYLMQANADLGEIKAGMVFNVVPMVTARHIGDPDRLAECMFMHASTPGGIYYDVTLRQADPKLIKDLLPTQVAIAPNSQLTAQQVADALAKAEADLRALSTP